MVDHSYDIKHVLITTHHKLPNLGQSIRQKRLTLDHTSSSVQKLRSGRLSLKLLQQKKKSPRRFVDVVISGTDSVNSDLVQQNSVQDCEPLGETFSLFDSGPKPQRPTLGSALELNEYLPPLRQIPTKSPDKPSVPLMFSQPDLPVLGHKLVYESTKYPNLQDLSTAIAGKKPTQLTTCYATTVRQITRFDSNFECGNVDRVYLSDGGKYTVISRTDYNTTGNQRWFCFTVNSTSALLKFQIILSPNADAWFE